MRQRLQDMVGAERTEAGTEERSYTYDRRPFDADPAQIWVDTSLDNSCTVHTR